MHYGRLYSETSHYTSWEYKHPPASNDTTNATFIDEITELLADRIAKYNMVILGDLNIHADDLSNTDSYIFNDTMHAFGFKQHVKSSTHKCGHILDLIFSEMNSELNPHNCTVHKFISDHALVTIVTTLNKAPWEPTEKMRDTTMLTKEILEEYYTTPVIESNTSLEQACDQFNEELPKMLNRAAPQEKVRYTDRPKNHGTTSIFVNKKELSKTEIISTKTQRSLIKDQINDSIIPTAFAADHSICKNFKAGNKAEEHKTKTDLEEAFTQLKCWMDVMCLKLNPNKTEYILFGSWQQLKKTSLNAQGDPIAVSKAVRYLGGFLDQHLNFRKHIKEKAKKVMANIIKIHAICKYLTVQSCTTLVLMLYITHLNYANAILHGLPSITLRKYQTIQNQTYPKQKQVLELIMGTKESTQVSHTTKDKIQNPDNNIQVHHWHGTKVLIGPNQHKKTTHSTICTLTTLAPYYILQTPKVKYQTFVAWSFTYSAPTLWNQLWKFIKDSSNLDILKKKLMTHLFQWAFNPD